MAITRSTPLTKCDDIVPFWLMARLINFKRHDNFLIYRNDGFHSLHRNRAQAFQTAERMDCDYVINLRK